MSWRAVALSTVTFAAVAWWSAQSFAESTALVGGIAAVATGAMLIRPQYIRWAPVVAAVLAGMWIPVIASVRVPIVMAFIVAAAVPLTAAWLRRTDPAFAPASMCEEALLLVLAIGVVVAAAPTIADGWQAAANLKLQGPAAESASNMALPMWAVTTACAALLCGGLYSLWSRR